MTFSAAATVVALLRDLPKTITMANLGEALLDSGSAESCRGRQRHRGVRREVAGMGLGVARPTARTGHRGGVRPVRVLCGHAPVPAPAHMRHQLLLAGQTPPAPLTYDCRSAVSTSICTRLRRSNRSPSMPRAQ